MELKTQRLCTPSECKSIESKSVMTTDDEQDELELEEEEDFSELLSDDNGDTFTDTDDKEHDEMLENSISDEIKKGHMLNQADFELLHYEDPMILKLKQTDVIILFIIVINGKALFVAVVVVRF